MEALKDSPDFLPPTPAYVLDVPLLDRLVTSFEEALENHWPNYVLSYSVKTNSLPWLLAYMRQRGVWAEVVSDTEYELALETGHHADRIVYNGPIKGRERLRAALLECSIVNLDAKREVEWAAELAAERPDVMFKIGLRVNWDLESRVPGESTAGDEGSRFGFNAENGELDQAIARLTAAGASVAGLHMHRNSVSQSLAVYRAAAAVAAEIITTRNLDLEWLDIGGGFFGNLEGSPTFDEYVSVIRAGIEHVVDPDRTRLIVEPGGSLVAIPLEFHASVIDVKKVDTRTFVVTNASRINIDPNFRRIRPYKVTSDARSDEVLSEQIISGFTCIEEDRIMRLKDAVALQPEDRIVFYRVGGYTMSHQQLFIEYLPAVYVRDEDSLTLVRSKWGVREFLQGNQWTAGGGLVAATAGDSN
ncbi:MAG: hypothetical protein ACTHXA_11825 [Gulosibacter sp.]|uniref:hypothetical protein n=1 Tax=Gulosibacter sp. TaxID=2817531 RepID=UPI003F90FD19